MTGETAAKESEATFITWRWLTPVLMGLLITIGTAFARGVSSDIETLKREQTDLKAASEMRIQSLEGQLVYVRAAQEREHRLLVRIAQRMGIEVAE